MAIPFYKMEGSMATQLFMNALSGNVLFGALAWFAYRLAADRYYQKLKLRTISNK